LIRVVGAHRIIALHVGEIGLYLQHSGWGLISPPCHILGGEEPLEVGGTLEVCEMRLDRVDTSPTDDSLELMKGVSDGGIEAFSQQRCHLARAMLAAHRGETLLGGSVEEYHSAAREFLFADAERAEIFEQFREDGGELRALSQRTGS